MNVLTDPLPHTVFVLGEEYPVRTDFRAWIRFSIQMQEVGPNGEKLAAMLSLLEDRLPPKFEETIRALLEFYAGGEQAQDAPARSEAQGSRIYDFAYDGGLIYAAFFQQYGLDLQRAKLHWWQFKALFNALSEDTQFMKVVGYRGIDAGKIKDKTQREFYQRMKRQYALPIPKSEREQLSRIEEALLSGGDLTGLV